MSEQYSTNPLTANSGAELTTEASSPGFMSGLNIDGHPAIRGLAKLTMARQVAIMLGLALSVAIGIAVVLWSQDANYARLYTELNDKDTGEILDALNAQGVKYKIEEGGSIMVLADKVNDLKIKLAAQGLPKSNSLGYELLDKEQSFGTSKSAELSRFQRALEGEITRTIMSIQSVKSARVLLALPVQSVFVRERKKPSASVIVHLYQGRSLDKGQVEAIVHLVASSVPQLDADHVTVVDYKGQLLNTRSESNTANLTANQFDYKTNIEEHLMHRIENILSPLVGAESMRVQISADVDFTETDKTQEMFNPDLPALRSEQTTDEHNKENPQGVPGALTNQPTPAGAAIEAIPPAQPNSIAVDTTGKQGYGSKTATRNYELDKTITHTRLASGLLRRLSVAVVVDDRHITQTEGAAKAQPYAQEDLNRFNDLVKQAVGFDSGRGDAVTVTNVSFRGADLDSLPELPLWKEVWFIELMKQVVAVLAILFLIFGVLRPTIRGLMAKDEAEKRAIIEAEEQARAAALLAAGFILDGDGSPLSLTEDEQHKIDELLESMELPKTYQNRLDYLKRLVDEDPKVVAQVLKSWIRKDV